MESLHASVTPYQCDLGSTCVGRAQSFGFVGHVLWIGRFVSEYYRLKCTRHLCLCSNGLHWFFAERKTICTKPSTAWLAGLSWNYQVQALCLTIAARTLLICRWLLLFSTFLKYPGQWNRTHCAGESIVTNIQVFSENVLVLISKHRTLDFADVKLLRRNTTAVKCQNNVIGNALCPRMDDGILHINILIIVLF